MHILRSSKVFQGFHSSIWFLSSLLHRMSEGGIYPYERYIQMRRGQNFSIGRAARYEEKIGTQCHIDNNHFISQLTVAGGLGENTFHAVCHVVVVKVYVHEHVITQHPFMEVLHVPVMLDSSKVAIRTLVLVRYISIKIYFDYVLAAFPCSACEYLRKKERNQCFLLKPNCIALCLAHRYDIFLLT